MARKHHNHHHHQHHRDGNYRGRRGRPHRPYTSPFELIREDFQRMVFTMRLRTTEEAADNILMQSCEGHAQMGHGAFAGRRFPNTEMEDIVNALGRNPMVVAEQRQALIDEVCEWVDLALEGTPRHTLVNEVGDGLIGCGLLRHFEVNPEEVLRGLYLGGQRDDSARRAEAEREFGITIGGGRLHFVDTEVMERMNYTGDQLAQSAHEGEIEDFRAAGLIVDDPGPGSRNDRIRYMYIRDRVGGGASDDAAIIAAGKLYGFSTALGVFLADAVDTLEKFVVDYRDQDDELAKRIEQQFPKLNLTQREVYQLIWLNAVPPEHKDDVPDSSLRQMLQIDQEADQNALESHLAYVAGHPFSPMTLGHQDIPNTAFYEWFEGRLRECPG